MRRARQALMFVVLALGVAGPASAGAGGLDGSVLPNPLTVTLGTHRASVEQGEAVAVTATVVNAAAYELLATRLSLRPDGNLILTGQPDVTIGALPGSASREVSWTVCAPAPGNYVIVALADAQAPNGTRFESQSPSRLIEAVAGGRVCGGYDFDGLLTPVDNPPTVNGVTAGVAVPVKFRLGGDQGLDVFAAGYPASVAVTCDSRQPTDTLEATVTAGSSSLSYDAASDVYTYAWKTERKWAGTCRQLVLMLSDGTLHRAEFRFRK